MEWISTEDRTPEELEPALCFSNGGIFILTLDPFGIWMDYMGECFYSNPTHWMPLPDVPKETK